MSHLIQVDQLEAHLATAGWVIVDTRYSLQDPEAGRKAYDEGHIPGAVFLDLGHDLSGPKAEHGGRHPLPDPESLAQRLGQVGIGNQTHVVVYDDANNMFAGRLWWLLRYLGHDQVQVLDGGMKAWLGAGYKLMKGMPEWSATEFEVHLRPEMLVDSDYVKQHLDDPQVTLVDARAADRFRGENETIDPVAGHIPGALNRPFMENLDQRGFKPPNQLRAEFQGLGLDNGQELIVYCGSGVTASHNLIALEEAGIKGAKLYVGSWSDWISHHYPIETQTGKPQI